MAKHTFKILRWEQEMCEQYVWPFYNIIHESVKVLRFSFKGSSGKYLQISTWTPFEKDIFRALSNIDVGTFLQT